MNRALAGLALAPILASILAGCGGSDSVTQSQQGLQGDVGEVAALSAVGATSASAAGGLVTGMMGILQPETGAKATCPATFDLGNGITGTCVVAADGTVTMMFGGSVVHHGRTSVVSGTLVATPQPNGSTYTIAFSATVAGSLVDKAWQATGTVTLDANDDVTGYDLTINVTVTRATGGTLTVSVRITPTQFTLTATGPRGNNCAIDLDRTTLSGTISANGVVVASVTLNGNCATVDFVNPQFTDGTYCR